eukprot:CAMPEP_0170180400 /NCGR_PEP_ID=MMETSP0040_2-20121228/21902_1 /TAXON_ID=641309 /ORGANISM="Lotharella oceanica, Strain CCMP622" /LENGTH=252 /DNA_ID=CAMNT_0010425025 /DNA_START=345 /DNA_END=1103 /DNA_ORIENTATION=-
MWLMKRAVELVCLTVANREFLSFYATEKTKLQWHMYDGHQYEFEKIYDRESQVMESNLVIGFNYWKGGKWLIPFYNKDEESNVIFWLSVTRYAMLETAVVSIPYLYFLRNDLMSVVLYYAIPFCYFLLYSAVHSMTTLDFVRRARHVKLRVGKLMEIAKTDAAKRRINPLNSFGIFQFVVNRNHWKKLKKLLDGLQNELANPEETYACNDNKPSDTTYTYSARTTKNGAMHSCERAALCNNSYTFDQKEVGP